MIGYKVVVQNPIGAAPVLYHGMVCRCLLELPHCALDLIMDQLNAPEFFIVRQASRSVTKNCVLSTQSCRSSSGAVPRPRCFVASLQSPEVVERLRQMHLPSLKVIVLKAPIRMLVETVHFLCSKMEEFKNLEVLHLAAPVRHHLGDTGVRMLATALRSWPVLRELGLPGLNVTRWASAALGKAVAASPCLRSLDLSSSLLTSIGWTHLICQAEHLGGFGGDRRVKLVIASDDPVHALRGLVRSSPTFKEVNVAKVKVESALRCECLQRCQSTPSVSTSDHLVSSWLVSSAAAVLRVATPCKTSRPFCAKVPRRAFRSGTWPIWRRLHQRQARSRQLVQGLQ
ncbi:unnamed protein product [Durusdinium trenchii]|uniref:F-box domain-containing protein n=1 Tax=Durusdinium trenchii TaxID=1381693 RepID=A0ABP0KMF9_9DINO